MLAFAPLSDVIRGMSGKITDRDKEREADDVTPSPSVPFPFKPAKSRW